MDLGMNHRYYIMNGLLSIATSVAGLLSLGLQSTDYFYKYYTAYRD